MGEVHVPDVETGAFPRKASWAEGRKAPLVCKFGQRVGLVHELGKLGPAKEFADCRHYGPDVDQPLRSRRFRVHQRHFLLDHALHAEESDADLVLDQFSHGAYPAVAQVINVVHLALALVDKDHCAYDRNNVLAGQRLWVLFTFPADSDAG